MSLAVVFRTRPKVGETANGDAGFVRHGGAHTLFAVIDALGHGPVAAIVAERARDALETAPLDRGVLVAVERVHESLKGTRGAALTVGLHAHGSSAVELAGVGNVIARSFTRSLPFVASPGVLGARMSRPRASTIELQPNESLLIASDGLPRRTGATLKDAPDAVALCESLLDLAHAHDDATVMIVRLEGGAPC